MNSLGTYVWSTVGALGQWREQDHVFGWCMGWSQNEVAWLPSANTHFAGFESSPIL